ncbi:MAG: RNA methyltransferase [Flavobacteriales bacterium]|nr:MAG: RNA methyltransferase [Flavobacteriales bacterium]
MPATDRKLTIEELGRIPAEDYRHGPRQRLVVVLDDVRSRHNVGSIFRSADAFGVERIVLCGFTPCPPHREIEKTALGATQSVPWEHCADPRVAVERLQAEGYRVVAVEQTLMAVPLERAKGMASGPLALVLGNELHGVSDEVVRACDACLVVPQRGSKHSLNVSVCAGVVLHALTAEGQDGEATMAGSTGL